MGKFEGVATLDNVCSKKCSNEALSCIVTLSMESCFESMRMQASASWAGVNSDMEICLCRSRLSVSEWEQFGGTTLTERELDLVLYE